MKEKDLEKLEKIYNKTEYNLISSLNKIGYFFKVLFYIMLFSILSYILFIVFFNLNSLEVEDISFKNNFKKAIFNISFSSKKDFKHSKIFINDYDKILYNKLNSTKLNYSKKFIPIYQINIKGRGELYSLNKNIDEFSILNENFYVIKNIYDESSYFRNTLNNLSELYSGKVVLEYFSSNNKWIDFINLMFGAVFSKNLYHFKYTQALTNIILNLSRQKEGFFISSYNNTDSSSHADLLKSFNIYYRDDLLKSIENGNYFLSNDIIVSGKNFDFNIKNNKFNYKINYNNKFKVLLFNNGKLKLKSFKNNNSIKLEKGVNRFIVLKKERYFLGDIYLFAYYINVKY